MTTGDEEAEGLVDDLFRDVDDQFKDLEREYSQAREELALADAEGHDTASAVLQASNERFELVSQVATLQAEVSRQGDELDERDRMLGELGDRIVGFEAELANRDETLTQLHAAKQEALDERREQARLAALLEARAAERQELADVANRLQNERDHVQELLTTALARFDEAEAAMVQMDDKVRHLEAARDTAAHEHDARAHELIESRAEMSKLADQVGELNRTAVAAEERAEKADALAERRTNEAGYLNRRIDALNHKLETANSFERDATELRRELTMAERRIAELDRNLASQTSETAVAKAAVDAIAERTSDYDELVAQIERVTQERDEAWEAASGYPVDGHTTAPAQPPVEPVAASAEVASLAERARELSARRSNEAANAAQAAEDAAAHAAVAAQFPAEPQLIDQPAAEPAVTEPALTEPALTEPVVTQDAGNEPAVVEATISEAAISEPMVEETMAEDAMVDEILGLAPALGTATELHDLEADDVDVIEADLAAIEPDEEEAAVEVWVPEADELAPAITIPAPVATAAPVTPVSEIDHEIPAFEFDPVPSANDVTLPRVPEPEEVVTNTAEIPAVHTTPVASTDADGLTESGAAERTAAEPAAEDTAAEIEIPLAPLDHLEAPLPAGPQPVATDPAGPLDAGLRFPQMGLNKEVRKRTILPADLVPNTPEAVAFLLNQPGVTAIVDARSTCGRTGIRPSELFDRVAALRDHFDVPVEVVVTPVSTPVGGAPDLPAIGVHHVTGADTVADRIRALCMGFPADQSLVVVAGDDHVRRAAIGEEANVVEPSAVVNLAND